MSEDSGRPQAIVVPCSFLRNQGMYLYSGAPTRASGSDDSTIYWCVKTMKGFGPDDELVDRGLCADPARSCYEPT